MKKDLLEYFFKSIANHEKRISLVSVPLFNGTSTSVVYLIPKLSLYKNGSYTIKPKAGGQGHLGWCNG